MLLYGSAAVAVSVEDVRSDAELIITDVEVTGVGFFEARAIRGEMLSVPAPWYKPWRRWLDPVPFDQRVFRTDLERIRANLREAGYYEAEVAHDLTVTDGEIAIAIVIEPGQLTAVASIAIIAADFTLSADAEASLRAKIPLAPEKPFTQKDYDASRAALEQHYLEESHAYAVVAKSAVVDTAAQSAAVEYTITRGPTAVFGATTVTGLTQVEERLVRREITYEPGSPYTPTKIEETQASVFGLDLFRSVIVRPTNLEARSGVVDIAIEVAEGPARSIKLGLGYGLEDQVRGQIQWQHNNFLGGGRQLGVRLKGSFIEQSVAAEFRQPYFLSPKQTLVIPLTQGRFDEPGYDQLQVRLAPRVERKVWPDVTAALGYNIEYDRLSDVPEETVEALDEFRDRGIVSSWNVTVQRNTAGDLLNPQLGSVVSLAFEQGGGPWQGDYTFYRTELEAKKYIGFWAGQVFATRFRIGAGDGFGDDDDLPLFRRFFSGGIIGTRGYARHKLGPLTSDEDPIGGRSLMEGSVELRTPVWRDLGAVVFFDAGVIDLKPFRYDLDELQYSTGPGIRYDTPVGPLRLDVGFALNPPSGLPSWQLHFSIGQAF